MLDQAFEALASYDPGVDPKVLSPIDEAVITTHGDAAARRQLEDRLCAVLTTNAPYMAKDYVCRQLRTIGTEACVATLADLLADATMSHMARYALERIPASEAAAAMRQAAPQLEGPLKIGVIASLGVRGDAASVPMLSELISSSDGAIAAAAAYALGDICTTDAATALTRTTPTTDAARRAVTDAKLACGEALLASGKKGEALAIYKGLAGDDQPKLVRLAATRGMLACAGKQ